MSSYFLLYRGVQIPCLFHEKSTPRSDSANFVPLEPIFCFGTHVLPPNSGAQVSTGKVLQTKVAVRVFVVTYADEGLDDCLRALLGSDIGAVTHEIYVLNNRGVMRIPDQWRAQNIRVLNNMRRPDW